MTLDAWYTLIYLRTQDRERLERLRTRAWSGPLVAAGLDRAAALRAVEELFAHGAVVEALGRTPPIPVQCAWLARHVGRRVRFGDVADRLDAALSRSRVRTAPGALEALERLASSGVRLGVVSNVRFESGAATRGVLSVAGVLEHVGPLVLSCEQPWSKPRPEPFRLCLRQLRVRAAEALHVGDLPYDAIGARRAGLEPVLYTGLHRWEVPRPRFPRLVRPQRTFARWVDAPTVLLRGSTSRRAR